MASTNIFNFLFITAGLLACGTFNSLIAKIIYGLKAPGLGGHVHYFRKPWFQTTNMFVGMILCMAIYYAKLLARAYARKKKAEDAEQTPLLRVQSPSEDAPIQPHKSGPLVIMAVSLSDLAATGLMFSGLVFTTVSVYQMLRGAEVIFCAFLSVTFLKRHLDSYMRSGIFITVMGIVLVGLASVTRDTSGEEEQFSMLIQLFGILLIVLAQFLQAIQMIIEEWLLQDVQMDTMELAGWEGIWGGILCVFVFLPLFQTIPGPDMGCLENTEDSLLMLKNNWHIILAEVLNFTSVLTYNYFGLTLTQDFTAMHRVIIEASRSLLVWISDLVIFYFITDGAMGESWTRSSWIQLVGFIVLLIGTVVYNYTTLYAEVHISEVEELSQVGEALQDGANGRTVSKSSIHSHSSHCSTGSARLGRI